MTTTQKIRIAILIIAICFFIYRQYRKKTGEKVSTVTNPESPNIFYSINDGNQIELIYAPNYNSEWFEELKKKYSWDSFDEYDNIFCEYMYMLFDTLPEIAGKTESDHEFFNNLTRQQKFFYSLLTFTGDTDNGGVTQFFFNRPEFSFAVLETLEELKMTKLKTDYEKCLNEFIGTSNSYAKRKEIFNKTNLKWEKRWKAFTDGYSEIKSADILEDYFYSKEFKKELYKTFVEYADKNIDKFVRK